LKHAVKVVAGLVVSGLLLWWVFRGQDLREIGRQLAHADLALLVLTGAISTSGGVIRALRWRLLLEPLGVPTTLRARWASLNIGFMVTNLFPARLGEVVRPFALSRMAPVTMSGALGTVALERVLDTVALLVLTLATLLSPAFPKGATALGKPLSDMVGVGVLVAAAALAALAAAMFWPRRLVRVLRSPAMGALGAGAADRVDAFLTGLQLVRRPGAILKALAWSLLLWMWMAAGIWMGFRAFGIDQGFTAAMFTECALSLVIALPAAPGFIGTMQAGISVGLHEVFGVPSEPTLSMAVGYHLAGFIPVTLIGLYYAWAVGFSLRSIEADAAGAMKADTVEPRPSSSAGPST
jgi:glycosyltransferase 2 family protein